MVCLIAYLENYRKIKSGLCTILATLFTFMRTFYKRKLETIHLTELDNTYLVQYLFM